MSQRFLIPLLMASIGVGVVGACSSDGDSAPGTSGADGGDSSVAPDAAVADAARDDVAPAKKDSAPETGEGGLPALCKTYPDTNVEYEGEIAPRWTVIAYRAMELAAADCAISASFSSFNAPGSSNPVQPDCYTVELRAVAECPAAGGGPVVYDGTARDSNFDLCLPAVTLGFKNASASAKDVEKFIARTREAAVLTGLAAADGDRLQALLLARKSTAVTSASADYTNSSCDGGM